MFKVIFCGFSVFIVEVVSSFYHYLFITSRLFDREDNIEKHVKSKVICDDDDDGSSSPCDSITCTDFDNHENKIQQFKQTEDNREYVPMDHL